LIILKFFDAYLECKNLDPGSGSATLGLGICFCTVPTGPLKFEVKAFIAEAFSFQRHLAAFGALMFLLEAKLFGPLLL
jgi:hypothetical protein